MNNGDYIRYAYDKYSKEKPVIDIGCGQYRIFDFDHMCFDKARIVGSAGRTCANVFGDFHNMSMFDNEQFAFVFACNCLEHAKQPEMALSEWNRILKTNGVMCLIWPKIPVDKKHLDRCIELEQNLEKGMEEYLRINGNTNWISYKPDGTKFLDAHWNYLEIVDILKILPNYTVLEQEIDNPDTDYRVILRKNKVVL